MPLSMFYDFHQDRENPTIDLDLKPTTRLRYGFFLTVTQS